MDSKLQQEKCRDEFGITPMQLEAVVAIMAHWNVYGTPVQRTRLVAFIGNDNIYSHDLERKRWIEKTSTHPIAYVATRRAWQLLGMRPRNFCRIGVMS